MAAEKSPNLQDVFLNHVRKNKIAVTIFLINGVKLQGVISSFDNFCLLLRRDGHVQLVYKHAVSTVMPSAPIRLYDPSQEAQGAAANTTSAATTTTAAGTATSAPE
ncbi:MAG: RNA chaperone Hfq [Alphaproteobacteria bacterium]